MNISDLKDYKIVSAPDAGTNPPTNISQLSSYSVAPKSAAPTKTGLQTASDVVGSVFPGQKLGQDIGTLAGYGIEKAKGLLGGKDNSKFYDLSAPTPLQAAGDAANAALLVGATAVPGAGSFAGKVAQGAALGYGSDIATRAANNGPKSLMPGLGTGVGIALPLAGSLVGALAKKGVAITSGTGEDVLNQALKNPDAVNEAINTYATTPEAKQSLVDKARGSINSFLHDRSTEYGAGINQLTSQTGFQGKDAAVSSFEQNVGKFGGSIKGNDLTFTDTTLTKADQKNLQDAFETISGWKNTSVKGLDNLRQAVGNLMDDFKTAGNPRANTILGQVKSDLTEAISAKTPGYKDILSTYGQKTQSARNLIAELSQNSSKPSTQLNAVMKIIKKDPSVVANLTKVMGADGANQFLNEVSGAVLSDWFPPGIFGNVLRGVAEAGGAAALGYGAGIAPAAAAAGAGLASASPRIVGKGAVIAGRAINSGLTTGLKRAATIGASRLNP
jgi:F0F1-type ATP synthase delta subunit